MLKIGQDYIYTNSRMVYNNKTYRYNRKKVTERVTFLGTEKMLGIFQNSRGEQFMIHVDDIPEHIKEAQAIAAG